MQCSLVAVSALAGAVLLGAAIGATTPTAMLDKTSGDWRLAVPQHAATLAYIPVGSAPESAEFGRRPLDAALLATASYSGDTVVLSEASDVELVGDAAPHYAPAERAVRVMHSAAPLPPDASSTVAVHAGIPAEPPVLPQLSDAAPEAAPQPPADATPPGLAAALSPASALQPLALPREQQPGDRRHE